VNMHIVLTALATVLGGALALAVGQVAVEGAVRPALELKRLIGAIIFDLDYHANRFSAGSQEWIDTFRKHACSLREKLNLIVLYGWFRYPLRLPPRQNVVMAAGELMAHSNRSGVPGGVPGDRSFAIKELLSMAPGRGRRTKKPSGWLRLGVVASFGWALTAVIFYCAGIIFYPSTVTTWLSRLYIWVDRPPVMDHGIEFTPLAPTPHVGKLLLLVAIPLLFVWLFFFLLPRSVRWVLEGFRDTQQT
jgi:hypothetical protein